MIIVIGSINLDLIGRVERLPEPGETLTGSSFATMPGGKGANQALAACRAGATVRMVGATGDDQFANSALSLLRQDGVNLSSVKTTDAATGTAMILVDAKGENVIAVIPGANAAMTEEDIDISAIASGDIVLLQQEIPHRAVAAALHTARQRGAISLLNTAPYSNDTAGMLAQADYVIANETEFALYAATLSLKGASRREQMLAFTSDTGRILIVTLGGDGLVAAQGEKFFEIPALPIVPVDTVGAGDTFCGYFAAALFEGLGLEEALRRASVAGALACLIPGAQPSIPYRNEVDEKTSDLPSSG